MEQARRVFITGGTGYIGTCLIPELHAHGCDVIALVREQSRANLPRACTPVTGDALNGDSYRKSAEGADTFVHLVGVSHPSPAKAKQFREIDLQAGLEAIRVARDVGVNHFVYVSVAQPAPVMHTYQAVRAECEQAIASSGIAATVLARGTFWDLGIDGHTACSRSIKWRSWFHRPAKVRLRLGLLTIRQMVRALVHAVDQPSEGVRVLDVPGIRSFGNTATDDPKKPR